MFNLHIVLKHTVNKLASSVQSVVSLSIFTNTTVQKYSVSTSKHPVKVHFAIQVSKVSKIPEILSKKNTQAHNDTHSELVDQIFLKSLNRLMYILLQ